MTKTKMATKTKAQLKAEDKALQAEQKKLDKEIRQAERAKDEAEAKAQRAIDRLYDRHDMLSMQRNEIEHAIAALTAGTQELP